MPHSGEGSAALVCNGSWGPEGHLDGGAALEVPAEALLEGAAEAAGAEIEVVVR